MVVLNLLIYVTSVDSNKWHLCKPITFASVKVYCLITLICLIILISHIVQLLLIREFYCFRPSPHFSFIYAQHNHLRCPKKAENIGDWTYIVEQSKSAKRFPLRNLKLLPRKELVLSVVRPLVNSERCTLVVQGRTILKS